MNIDKIKFSKFFHESKKNAIKRIVKCYHPDCNEKSINSHILQKNGILSSISKDSHLWEHVLNQFKEPHFQFKRTGINEIFSFNCFCQKHDSELFKIIETESINFNDYRSCLLFTLRTIYNEKFRKEVNIDIYQTILKSEFSSNPGWRECHTRAHNQNKRPRSRTNPFVWAFEPCSESKSNPTK